MILDNWINDAEKLGSNLPKDAEVVSRVGYLLGNVAPRAIEGNPADFSRFHSLPLTALDDAFLVFNTSSLHSADDIGPVLTQLISGEGLASVLHCYGERAPSILALPPYNNTEPIKNGSILLHELEHITQREEGLIIDDNMSERQTSALVGRRERDAYGLNITMLHAIDGRDFNRYIDSWPATLEYGPSWASISFHDKDCPVPPRETLAHEMWAESLISQRLLQSIGRIATLLTQTIGFSEGIVNLLIGDMLPQANIRVPNLLSHDPPIGQST